MIWLIIGLFAVAGICLTARFWLFRNLKAKFLIGQIVYNCPNPFIIYDFTHYESKGIVAVQVGTQEQKNSIMWDTYVRLIDKGYSPQMIDKVLEEIEDEVDIFYVKDVVIPYNRLKRRYEKWKGDLKIWDC